ncbi:MAG TPA: arsenic resistance N-acetyltransferase ArsN2 [Longimicrobiales bacterium]|nr:arsenic resistance N-acetyltransferase ArsN2 [Longimicrobiales bacterium]
MDADSGVDLRRATASDLEGMLRLLEGEALPTAGVADSLGGFVVAEAEGRLVGVAGLEVHGGDGVLRSVAVRPAYRGLGIGGRLVERVLDAARRADLRRLYLLTTTAEGYFRRHGFRPIERSDVAEKVRESVEFREACPASAVAMVLENG